MTKKAKKILIPVISVVIVVAIVVGSISYFAANKNKNLTIQVQSVMNMATDYWENDTSYGIVQSGYSQRIYADGQNLVQEFYVQEGDKVQIGDPILSYDPTTIELEAERQQLNINAMDVRYDRLIKELNRLKNTTPSDASSLSVRITQNEESASTEISTGESSVEDSKEESSQEENSLEDSQEDSKEDSREDSLEDSSKEESSVEESSMEESSMEESSTENSSSEDSSGNDEPDMTPIDVLTDQSKPYAGTGTIKDPYRYVITQNTKLMQSFYERWIGLEPVYCVFEKYKLDDPAEGLRYAWYMTTENLMPPQKMEIWDLGVYLTKLDENSMILVVAQEKLPKEMVLSMNLVFYVNQNATVTVVGANLLTEEAIQDGYLNLELGEGGLYNLYIKQNDTPGEDSSGEDSSGEEPIPDPDPDPIPDPDPDPTPVGPTKEELQRQIKEKEMEIRDLEISKKMAELELDKTQKKLEDTVVRSKVNGKVTSVQPDGAMIGEPLAVVTGNEGFYVTGVMSEFNLAKITLGQKVTGSSWMTGESFEGTITEIGRFPTSAQSGSSSDNLNVSYYPFTVYFDDYSALEEGQYIDLSLSAQTDKDTFCIPKMYIREENGQSYVFADNNGVLEKRYVTLGRSLSDGYYMEILDGLTLDDMIAFPYGKAAQEGVKTVQQNDGLV